MFFYRQQRGLHTKGVPSTPVQAVPPAFLVWPGGQWSATQPMRPPPHRHARPEPPARPDPLSDPRYYTGPASLPPAGSQATAHLYTLPCACRAVYRHNGAGGFPELHEAAWQDGWRTDLFGDWHCRACVQTCGYWGGMTLTPVSAAREYELITAVKAEVA